MAGPIFLQDEAARLRRIADVLAESAPRRRGFAVLTEEHADHLAAELYQAAARLELAGQRPCAAL